MRTNIFIGVHGRYKWLERTDGYLWDVLEIAPQVVEGRHVSITASDSGPLTLSPEEVAQGWHKHGGLAVSPHIVTADQVPDDLFDEWYIFVTATEFSEHEVFVNHSAFSLHAPEHHGVQERSWSQRERIKPESYLAEGDNLIWVTTDGGLYERVAQALRAETARRVDFQLEPHDQEPVAIIRGLHGSGAGH